MTRAQIADPEFANKAREGREDEITRCIRGNQGCIGRVFKGLSINCTVNPAAGREARFGAGTLAPAEPARRWLVVGGGPGRHARGGDAARARARGHTRRGAGGLGGQINLILKTPGRETFGKVRTTSRRQLRKLGVDVRLGTRGTPELVAEIGADAVSSPPARCRRRAGSRRRTRSWTSCRASARRTSSRYGTCCSSRGPSASASSCSTTTARAHAAGVVRGAARPRRTRRARDAAATRCSRQRSTTSTMASCTAAASRQGAHATG